MHVDDCIYKRDGNTFRRTLLRESYRENGKVKKRTIANISHCSDEEIEAIKIALKYKNNLPYLHKISNGKCENGKSMGAVFSLYKVSGHLGFNKILGTSKQGNLNLWLVLARLIDQGSRLSAVRLARLQYGCEILGIDSLNEDSLYYAMDWIYANKDSIERNIFKQWEISFGQKEKNDHVFLYDITSSYVEGKKNELADWGYNRDKKKGKQQIVYGLLTDQEGEPLAVEVFKGNTKDNKTVKTQIEKIKKRFGCRYVTFVGDKGMIKSDQIEELTDAEFNYITSITKDQIRTLIKGEILQLSLFDEKLCEVEDPEKNIRYILRRNPYRVEEIKQQREDKISSIKQKVEKSNHYLSLHKRAKADLQVRELNNYIEKLKLNRCIKIKKEDFRKLKIDIDTQELEEMSKLDGCYVIKTNLPKEAADKELIHARYKALAEIEWAFRIEKSELEVRPFYVRKKGRTSAHFLIALLAYKIQRHLSKCWKDIDFTVPECIEALKTITTLVTTIGNAKTITVPKPNKLCKEILDRIDVKLPEVLPYKEVKVVTRKKLKDNRKRK